MFHIFPSLILSEGEEEDDADHNAEDVAATAAAAANDDDNKDNDSTSVPPKVKPMAAAATKTAKKKQRRQMKLFISLSPSCKISGPSQSRWKTPSPSPTMQLASTCPVLDVPGDVRKVWQLLVGTYQVDG